MQGYYFPDFQNLLFEVIADLVTLDFVSVHVFSM